MVSVMLFQLLKQFSRAAWILWGTSVAMLTISLGLLHDSRLARLDSPTPDVSIYEPIGPLSQVAAPLLNNPTSDVAASASAPSPPAPKPKPAPAPIHSMPHALLGLSNWRQALPIDTPHQGKPDQIDQPELANFSLAPYFYVNDAKTGVVFRAHAGGATTKNSKYPRSELREMTGNGTKAASWSNKNGVHTMTVRQAITHTPVAKPHVVAGQIHDDSDDVVMIRLEGSRLFVQGDGDDLGLLDENYQLGAIFTIKIVASNGHILIYYNDNLKVDYTKSKSDLYFKAGCYTQSNTDKGDNADAYGEVIIYSLKVEHT